MPRRTPWAELLQRVFEVDALRCPRSEPRLLAAIEDPEVTRKILGCLGLPARGARYARLRRAAANPAPSARLPLPVDQDPRANGDRHVGQGKRQE